MIPLVLAAALPVLFWDQPPDTAPALVKAGITRIATPEAGAAAWKSVPGLAVEALDPASAVRLAPPAVQMRPNEAFATRSPWIDTNGAAFLRQPSARFIVEAPGNAAPLAAAEAHLFGGAAAIHTNRAGLEGLAPMLAFLGRLPDQALPPLANIGYIDDGSEESAELLKLMVRRNLLFRIVSRPDRRLDLTVRFGSPDYPKQEAADPSAMAQKIRGQLTDARRLLRIYGSQVVIGRLLGDGRRARVLLLNYSAAARPVNGIRVRVMGRYPKHELAAFDTPGARLLDYVVDREATEFTLELLKVYAVVDLLR